MKKRVTFAKGNQKKFIENLRNKIELSWSLLAERLGIKEGTLRSYRFELCDLPYGIFRKAINMLDMSEKETLKKFSAKIRDEVLIIGRRCFGEQKKILSPININFKDKNLDLDILNINYSKYDQDKKIKIPPKLTPELAEEIGMHYGDGFLSEKRYDYRLKGNPKNEKEYYQLYIRPLFKRLFNVEVCLKESYKSYGFELRSKAIWEFKTKVIGIKPGKKYKITIPEKLKVNNIEILTSFIRGLFDTDGSLEFKTRYGYEKYYPCISISLTSKKLIEEVGGILKMLGFNPSVTFNDRYGRIFIYGVNALKKYEKLIGWSSQKNLNKLNDWKNRYTKLYSNKMADVAQWQSTRLWSAVREFDSPRSLLSKKENGNENRKPKRLQRH